MRVQLFKIILILAPFFLLIVLLIFFFNFASIFSVERSGFFEISKGENLTKVSQNLKAEGFYSHPSVFFFLALVKREKNFQAGIYSLKKSESVFKIIKEFSQGKVYKFKITFPEGLTLKETEKKLTQKFKVWNNKKVNLGQFRIGDFRRDYAFLKNMPPDNNLEGFLFPDTYYFTLDMTNEEVAKVFLGNFQKKLEKREVKNLLEKSKRPLYEIIIMASILEKEAREYKDKQKIADILWRRLKIGMPLQVDATINYVRDQKKRRLDYVDLQIDSPYNTYKYRGLPPGPICNPGIESVIAALRPEKNNFWYYLSTPKGEIVYSRIFEEHRKNKLNYLK